MNDPNENDLRLMKIIKEQRDSFNPLLQKDLYTQLARTYKISYDAYRKEGFTVLEALRLTVKYFD